MRMTYPILQVKWFSLLLMHDLFHIEVGQGQRACLQKKTFTEKTPLLLAALDSNHSEKRPLTRPEATYHVHTDVLRY